MLRRLLRHKQFLAGGFIILVLVLVAAFAPWIGRFDPFERDFNQRLKPPSAEHWLGTDLLGRDLFSQIVHGARLTLYVGLVSVAISFTIGVTLGVTAGYYGGWWDSLVTSLINIQLTFPSFLLALGVVAILGASLTNAVIAVGIQGIPVMARLSRGETLVLREMDYVEAMRSLGSADLRIMTKAILPNAFSSLLVMSTLQFPFAILMTAGLSFLGLGAQPPTTEWGRMMVGARDLTELAPWLMNVPGLAIMLTVFGFNLLGNALRDVLDPRLRE
jgi:peptide/nickel transport system permease protein